MDLRWRLAVVGDAGSGVGRAVAVRLGRRGASVLAVDPDLAAAEETVALVVACRVKAWAVQCAEGSEIDARTVGARAQDLGGADLVVGRAGSPVGDLLGRGAPVRRLAPGPGDTHDDVARSVVDALSVAAPRTVVEIGATA